MNQKAKLGVSGAAAGLVNGLFGGGGGMVMAPLLTGWCGLEQKRALATCVGVILPFCVLSAAIYVLRGGFDWLGGAPRGATPWFTQLCQLRCQKMLIVGERSLPYADSDLVQAQGITVGIVPHAGHSMAWENPQGLAQLIASHS